MLEGHTFHIHTITGREPPLSLPFEISPCPPPRGGSPPSSPGLLENFDDLAPQICLVLTAILLGSALKVFPAFKILPLIYNIYHAQCFYIFIVHQNHSKRWDGQFLNLIYINM